MKNFKNIFISLFVFCFLLVGFTACPNNPESDDLPVVEAPEEAGPEATKYYLIEEDVVKLLGRAYLDEGILWMGYSSTGIAFDVDANTLEIEIVGDKTAKGEEDLNNGARIAIFVDGKRCVDKIIGETMETITVFSSQKKTKGEVRVLKISESANSWAGIIGINTDEEGEISPAKSKDLKIEFIGDSITCGYGIDDENRNNHFKTSTEDNTKTYAYKTAEALNADYSMVSNSGWGIISGYSADGAIRAEQALPSIYSKLGFSWGNSSIQGQRPQDIEWDFSRFVPDVVVINLGTNDNSYTKGDSEKCKEYEDAYVNFIKDIRKKNPKSYIICTLGLMGSELYPSIQNAVQRVGDSKVVALQLNSTSSYGYAADWHPTEKANEKAAEILCGKIKELNILK